MGVVIVSYSRTPFAKYLGAFSQQPATHLGATAIEAARRQAGIPPHKVDRVVVGQVLQAGAGQNPARQAAAGAGIPLTVPATTLNAVCLSGLEAVAYGSDLISSGQARVVVAAGQESMSLAPHAWPGSRLGRRHGAVTLLDLMEHDGLADAFENRSMGASTEDHNEQHHVTRSDMDAWAASSHARAAASAFFLSGEITPVPTSGRDGETTVAADDGVRYGTRIGTLATLPPAFGAGGTITAGNSSPLTDGAAAVVLADEETVEGWPGPPLARVLSHAVVARPDVSLHAQPAHAALAALEHAGRQTTELDAVEINEAFAAVAVVSTRLLQVPPDIVNINGGAIALGHPIGASGARIVGHLSRRLAHLGRGALGVATICGGGGQGAALVLEAV